MDTDETPPTSTLELLQSLLDGQNKISRRLDSLEERQTAQNARLESLFTAPLLSADVVGLAEPTEALAELELEEDDEPTVCSSCYPLSILYDWWLFDHHRQCCGCFVW
jgi:hypothetical protein